MAQKLTPQQASQIIQLLLAQQGGEQNLKGALPVRQLLAGLLSSPETIASLQGSARSSVEPLKSFDPSVSYDPSMLATDVENKYSRMGGPIANFSKRFWEEISATGGNPMEVNKVRAEVKNRAQDYKEQFGIDDDTWDIVYGELDKDIESFNKQKIARDKKQYAAFLNKRKEAGIRSADTAEDDYLAATTGISGLGALPTSLEDVAKQRSAKVLAKFKNTKSADAIAKAAKEYEKQFVTKAKKSKRSAVDFGLEDLIKKNLGGL